MFALGQVAVGFVAVGQGAVGVIAVGQGAVGLISIGMGSVGIYWTGAMIGIGGSGFGGVIPLSPSLGRGVTQPPTVSWDEAREGDWVATRIGVNTTTRLQLPDGVRVNARLRKALIAEPEGAVQVQLGETEAGLQVDRVMRIPKPRWLKPNWYGIWAGQFAALVLLCTAYMGLAIFPWLLALWQS